MAFLGESFKETELPQGNTGDFEPLPAGWYSASITQADLKTTKAGNGNYISVRFDITGPTHQGRVVFTNLNIRNPNPKAEEIGRQQLGEIMRAIGLPAVNDTDQLLGGNCQIKLAIKTDDYGTKNEVKGYKAIIGAVPPAPSTMSQTQAPQAAPQAAPASARPPWAK